MSTTPVTPDPNVPPLTLEQKIDNAAKEAAAVAAAFNPAIATAINLGASIEPMISGYIQLLIGLFKHHTTGTPKPAVEVPTVSQ